MAVIASVSGVEEFKVCDGCMNSYRCIAMIEGLVKPSALKLFNKNLPDLIFQ